MEPDAESVKRDVAAALREDVGPGDITAALIPPCTQAVAQVATRDSGVFCGRPWVEEACRQVQPDIRPNWRVADGDAVSPGDVLVELAGPARALLTLERTAVNFMQLLSATATRSRQFVLAVADTAAVVLDTRKTLPGLRAAQKYAVRVGGARNHRMGLFDAYLLKENHIAAAGSIAAAIRQARRLNPDKPVQVEVENSAQLAEAIDAGADRVLLDNFSLPALRAAVKQADGRVRLEASGGITLETIPAIAETGVHYISVGELTKNVDPLDLTMRIVQAKPGESDRDGAGRRI